MFEIPGQAACESCNKCNLGQICSFSSASPLMSKSSVVAGPSRRSTRDSHPSTRFLTGNQKSAEKVEQQKPSGMHQSCPSSTWAPCGPTMLGLPYKWWSWREKYHCCSIFILLMRFAHWDRSRSTISHSTHGISLLHFGNMHLFDVYGVRHVRAIG